MPGFDRKKVGDRVRALIANSPEYGVQSSLARHLNITSTAVNRWAHGNGNPDPDLWPGIEQFFDLPPDTLTLVGLGITEGSGSAVLADLLDRFLDGSASADCLAEPDRRVVRAAVEILRHDIDS